MSITLDASVVKSLCIAMLVCFFFFKQKTAYEMRISDWSSDVCSSDLGAAIVFAPVLLVLAEVAEEGFLAPGAEGRRADRREGRYRLVGAGILQVDGDGAVPAHRVAHDALAAHVGGEMLGQQRGQLPGHVAVHVVALRPRPLRRIEIKADRKSTRLNSSH